MMSRALDSEVELENVPIRKDALRAFGIPIQVQSGIIGKIKLRIPIYQFKTAPWCVIIEHMYVVFSPKDVSDWDCQEESISDFDFKMCKLNSNEALWRAQKGYYNESFYYSSSYTNWLNYGSTIVTNIVENLELKIDHVHFRYEDFLTVPDNNFAVGLKIRSLTIQSTDCDWNPGVKLPREGENAYKLIQLNDFAVYTDRISVNNCCLNLKSEELLGCMETLCNPERHKFILTPVSVRAQCKRQRCQPLLRRKFGRKLSCRVLASEIKIVINEDQYKQIIGCYVGLQHIRTLCSFKISRPEKSISENAWVWWRHAARCNGYTFETKAEKRQKLKENLRYINVYKRFLLNSIISEEEKEFKSYVERKRPFFELNTLRNICFNSVAPNTNTDGTHTTHGKSMLFQWFPNWWGWYGNPSSDLVHSNSKVDVEEFQNIEDEILNVIEDTIGSDSYLKKELVFGNFDIELSGGEIFIYIETSVVEIPKTMIEIMIKSINIIVETRLRSESCLISLSIKAISVKDYITPGTEFVDLIKSHKKECTELSHLPVCNLNSNQIYGSSAICCGNVCDWEACGPWLKIQYEKKPIGFNTDVRFLMKCNSLDIIYNTIVLKWLVNFFTSPQNGYNVKNLLRNRKANFFQKWKKLIVGTLKLRKTWSFEVDIAAPHLIFIENPSDKNSSMLLVDFGRFQILKDCKIQGKDSNIRVVRMEQFDTSADYKADEEDMFLTPCSTPPVSASSYPESPKVNSEALRISRNNESKLENSLRNKLYDKYTIDIIDFQGILKQKKDNSSLNESSIFQFINKFNLSMEFERRIIHTTDPDYPSFILFGILPKLIIHINDKYIDLFFKILSTVFVKPTCEFEGNEKQTESYLKDFAEDCNIDLDHFVIDLKIDQLILELQSKQRSLVELQTSGICVRLSKEIDKANLSLSILGVLLVDAVQSYGPDFELLFASHKYVSMDTTSGCLTQSKQHSLIAVQPPLSVTCKRGPSFYAMSSTTFVKRDEAEGHIMMEIKYIHENNGAEPLRILKIYFNSLHLVANQETIAELIDFINTLTEIYKDNEVNFAKGVTRPQLNFSSLSNQRQTEMSFNFHSLNVLVLSTAKELKSSLSRKICTVTMNAAKIHASVKEELSITGTLGGLQIWNLSSDNLYHRRIISFGRDRLTNKSSPIQKDLLISCTKEIYGYIKSKHEEMENALLFKIVRKEFKENATIKITIRTTSVWYAHCNEFIKEIVKCVNQYQRVMKHFINCVRDKPADMTQRFVQEKFESTRNQCKIQNQKEKKCDVILKLDIVLNYPVLVIPRCSRSTEVLVANLGNICLYTAEKQETPLTSGLIDFANKKPESDRSYESVQRNVIKFKNMNVYSLDTSLSHREDCCFPDQQKTEDLYSCGDNGIIILHNATLHFDISNYLERKHVDGILDNSKHLVIEGRFMEVLEASLTKEQYLQVLEIVNNICNMQIKTDVYDINSSNVFQGAFSNFNPVRNLYPKFDDDTYNINIEITFSLPILVLTLKNEMSNPLFALTLRNVVATYNYQNNVHTKFKAVLKSILMEDLLCGIDSKFRRIVDSGDHIVPIKKSEATTFSSPGPVKTKIDPKSKQKTMILKGKTEEKFPNFQKSLIFPNFEEMCSLSCENRLEEYSDSILLTCAVNTKGRRTPDAPHIGIVIDYNSINVIISPEKWILILDFFIQKEHFDNICMNTSTNYSKADELDSMSTQKYHFQLYIKSLNFVFVRKDTLLAEANVSAATCDLKVHMDDTTFSGKLESISLADLTKFGKLYRRKLMTTGSEAVKVFYIRSNSFQKGVPLEKEAFLNIQISSVCYLHTKRFFTDILTFLCEFMVIQSLSNIESDAAELPIRLGLQIEATRSFILFPIHKEGTDLLIINLEKIALINSFHFLNDEIIKRKDRYITLDDEIVQVIQIDLKNLNLHTGKLIKEKEPKRKSELNSYYDFESFYIAKCGENIFKDNCFLKLQLELNKYSNNGKILTQIYVYGTLTETVCVLSFRQYKLIRGFVAYNLGENISDITTNPSESPAKKNAASNLKGSTCEETPSIVLFVHVDLDKVSLYLILDEKISMEDSCLASMLFTSFLEINFYSDSSKYIEFVLTQILIRDSRCGTTETKKKENNFAEIIKPIGSDPNFVQVQIHDKNKSNFNKYNVLLKNIRILAILDWMDSIRRYFSEHMVLSPAQTNNNFAKDLEDEIINGFPFEFIINIINSEIIFIENQSQLDIGAIVLKSTMIFSYKPQIPDRPITISISHLEVFSCIFEFENESALSIIDPITLDIELKNNRLNVVLPTQVYVRLSYYDIKLLLRLLRLISVQTSSINWKNLSKKRTDTNFEEIAPLVAMGFKPTDCFHAMEMYNNKINDAAVWLTQKMQTDLNTKWLQIFSIYVSGDNLSVCVIDDCKDSDVPLLEILLSRLSLLLKLRENTDYSQNIVSGYLETTIGIDYYNRRLSGWEPMIEPWECMTTWKYNTDNFIRENTFIDLQIKSGQLLKLNITTTLVELFKLVRTNWTQEYYQEMSHINANNCKSNLPAYRLKTPFMPFALKNQTGEMLQFKTIIGQPGGLTRLDIVQRDFVNDWIIVKPNETVPFTYGPQNKLRHSDSHKFNQHQIFAAVTGWTSVGPISIDKVGVYFRYSTEEELLRRSRIVFDISLVGSAQKLITVRSAIQIYNKLSFSIFLNIERAEHPVLIKPGDIFNVPLKRLNSPIYIHPIYAEGNEEAISDFCKDGITWWTCINDMQELFISRRHNETVTYILAVTKRDKYPKMLRMPGHTIALITPLTITNLLCIEIIFKTCASSEGCIHPSESANIYNINIYETFYISFYLDNYNISGQLRIPENLSGLAEPKLKMVDIHSRELYLRATIQFMKGRGMEILISAPIWLLNKTGLPLIFKQESAELETAGQFDEHEKARNITPLMFSFSDPDAPACLQIRLGNRYGSNNPWCKSFDLHKDIIHRKLQAEDSKSNYEIGINIRKGRGRYSYTEIVTVSPRYQIFNRSCHELQFAQKYDTLINEEHIESFTAISGCYFSFHWPHSDADPLLCVRLQDILGSHWSSGMPINDIHSVYINVRNDSQEMFFLRLEVIQHGASKYLLFMDAHALPPPIRINNYSDVHINFSQSGCIPRWMTSVRPRSTLAYVLDDPAGNNAIQIEAPGGRSIHLPLEAVENSRSFSYSNFLYIAFKYTFSPTQALENINKHPNDTIENQHLVLGVKDNKVVLMKKCTGDRSQLWLMNLNGQLEHEGTSPPIEQEKPIRTSRMVLDLEKPPNPMEYTNLVLRPPNKQRETTQSWRFEQERLKCHANMCIQVRGGINGLYSGAEVVVGLINSDTIAFDENCIPAAECIELQKLRPGSGYLEVISKMNGPTLTIQIRDLKIKVKDMSLTPDPLWQDATNTVKPFETALETIFYKISMKLEVGKGLGVSVISRCEELIFLTLECFVVDYINSSKMRTLNVTVAEIQVDNQLLDTCCPVLLHTKLNRDNYDSLVLNVKMAPSLNEDIVIIEYITVNFQTCTVILEERLLLKLALFLGLGKENSLAETIELELECGAQYIEREIPSTNSKRFYFESLYIGPCQIRLSLFTASSLSHQLCDMKKSLGLTLITFEDALIEFEKLSEKHLFEAMSAYLTIIRIHYKNQIKWHAASILGSVDFLGNPLGFANDLSEGVSGLIYEGSFKSLVRNITHGVSNSTAKLTETLSHSLVKVALDKTDNEARQKILEISSAPRTSAKHLTAGLKGFGFGLLGGMTSIVRHTYAGIQAGQGLHGIISGFGRGLIGTVAKPIIGVLDLTSETATALKETSTGSNRILRGRKRWPRCMTGAPGDLLPTYSYRQAQGQQYLYMINRRNFKEHLIFFEPNLCNDRELSLLVSTEFIRIISRSDEDPTMMLDYHLSEVLSCHTLISNMENFGSLHKPKAIYCIEISTNLPKITRPKIKCQNEATAKRASRYINYAKTMYDEKEQTLV